jgi:F420H(2)-dependent quinone reductase
MAVAADLDRATDSQWDWVAEQTRAYLASGGTEGHERDGLRMLVLVTTGRITGQPRRTCLIYGASADDLVVDLPGPPGVPGRTSGPLAADGAHLPAVRGVRRKDRA